MKDDRTKRNIGARRNIRGTAVSPYLDDKIGKEAGTCTMQVVFVDIVSYSLRTTRYQANVIHAFMDALREALNKTARQHFDYFHQGRFNIWDDVVKIPLGDGALIAFPFEGIPDLHLSFTLNLLKILQTFNAQFDCGKFRDNGFCDCHDAYHLRCGISDGRSLLFKDLNENYNIAGDPVNMAARVMSLAGGSQVFITADAHNQLIQMTPRYDGQFRKYAGVLIKHGLSRDVYQYIGDNIGVDISEAENLSYAQKTKKPRQRVGTARFTSSEGLRERITITDSKLIEPIADGNSVAQTDNLANQMQHRLLPVPPGRFSMGTAKTGRTTVELSQAFLMDKYPITQDVYERVVNANPSHFPGEDRPVENVSWIDAVAFCNALSRISGLPEVYLLNNEGVSSDWAKNGYRLPTESEWEYACLGGLPEDTPIPYKEMAWYIGNSNMQTHPVGGRKPNAFGLYDMLGNVWEWCNDWYKTTYPKDLQVDYVGPSSGLERVIRGGSWKDLPNDISVRSRFRKSPQSADATVGFRVVRRAP